MWISFFNVFVCIWCVCMSIFVSGGLTCVCRWIYTSVHVNVEPGFWYLESSLIFPCHIHWDRVSRLNPEVIDTVGIGSQLDPGIISGCLLKCWDYRQGPFSTKYLRGFWRCKLCSSLMLPGSPFTTEPSPQITAGEFFKASSCPYWELTSWYLRTEMARLVA